MCYLEETHLKEATGMIKGMDKCDKCKPKNIGENIII